jgi:hypothetical protein
MEAVGLQVVREAARAADSGDEHGSLRRQLLGLEKSLNGGEDRVVAATGTPTGNRAFIIRHRSIAVVLVDTATEK